MAKHLLRLFISMMLLFCVPSLLIAEEKARTPWKLVPGYTLYDLYQKGGRVGDASIGSKVLGTSGLSWPDGRQAIVTTIELKLKTDKWLYQCIDYFDDAMRRTGHSCSELRNLE